MVSCFCGFRAPAHCTAATLLCEPCLLPGVQMTLAVVLRHSVVDSHAQTHPSKQQYPSATGPFLPRLRGHPVATNQHSYVKHAEGTLVMLVVAGPSFASRYSPHFLSQLPPVEGCDCLLVARVPYGPSAAAFTIHTYIALDMAPSLKCVFCVRRPVHRAALSPLLFGGVAQGHREYINA